MSLIKYFRTKDVRITLEGDAIWFNAKDVAEILGYKQPDKAVRDHVKDDEKTLVHTGQNSRYGKPRSLSNDSNAKFYQINESGL